MKNWHFIWIIGLLLTVSCSSPQKLFEKGKYFKAFDGALDKLNSGDKDRKYLKLLNSSFSEMIDLARKNINVLQDGYRVRDLEDNLKQYHEVIKRHNKGKAYLSDENELKYAPFKEENDIAIEDAFLEGKDLLVFYEDSKNKEDARNAYYHFELVKTYGVGYRDIDQWLNTAQNAATIIYIVDADLDSDFSYQWDVDRRFDDLEGQEGFIKIVYDKQSAEGDCYVELDFDRLDIDEKESQSTNSYSKQIIDGYTTVTDSTGNTVQTPNYKTVTGTVTTINIKKTVSWTVDVDILKSSINCDLKEDRFRASVDDNIQLYEIRGDERAIPEQFLNKEAEQLEDTDDMVEELLDNLYNRIRNYLY